MLPDALPRLLRQPLYRHGILRLSGSLRHGILAALVLRFFAALMALLVGSFLLNSYLVYWHHWPAFSALPWRGEGSGWLYWGRWLVYVGVLAALPVGVQWRVGRTMRADAALYAATAAYLVRAAYWGVLLIGLVDMLISFLRVEGLLQGLIGEALTTRLGRPQFRGMYVHYPLLVTGLIIARYTRATSFIWLTLLVVVAEFQIVVSRFVFSYEQAFMGDLVRFWYAALFLFASAHTLLHEGHVRVDVLYATMKPRHRAMTNTVGAVLLGLPVCWTIMLLGLSGRGASIAGPLLGFEISQSGYGMYVKYLMAGFLLVFAVSMAFQFIAAFLDNAADMIGERQAPKSAPHATPNGAA